MLPELIKLLSRAVRTGDNDLSYSDCIKRGMEIESIEPIIIIINPLRMLSRVTVVHLFVCLSLCYRFKCSSTVQAL